MSNEATISFKGSSSYEQMVESSDDNTQPIVTHIVGSPEYIYPWLIIVSHKSIINKFDSNSFQEQRDRLILKINQFAELEKDWNVYGAIPIDSATKQNSINIIKQFNGFTLKNITSIFPYPHGTVGIKWRNIKTEEIASLEIGNHQFSCYSKRKDQPTLEFDGKVINEGIDNRYLDQLETEISLIMAQ